MSTDLYYYNTSVATRDAHATFPGVSNFREFFKIFPPGSVFMDRTGTIKIPFRTKTFCPVPTLRPISKSFDEICNERACELLERAEKLDVLLYVFWSGGIDSTLVLVSLLKNATPAQRKR